MKRRFVTPVHIGNRVLSSSEPVMVQSMLNTPTLDTEACVNQAVAIIEAGGELVRITARDVREAENLKNIKEGLLARGYDTPISADIHFVAEAAMVAAKYVDKVRINPGNFAERQEVARSASNGAESRTCKEESEAIARVREKLSPLIALCKERGVALRIGTNHGSLSERIMKRFGDTPEGMVEATMEYLRICREEHFDNIVISLKASDPRVMVQSVRMMVEAMDREEMHYPLHIGVTEAGEGEDGRIKSALGIGTLLCEGIGDTIRVSLTESPEAEIPVAKRLIELCCPAEARTAEANTAEATPAIDSTNATSPATPSSANCDAHTAKGLNASHSEAGNTHREATPSISIHLEGERLRVESEESDEELLKLLIPAKCGSALLSGEVKELTLELPNLPKEFATQLAEEIMQAAGIRRYKTEFVSCPGCGRTLFDLQKAVREIKREFTYIGVNAPKIAIMGCIVNGPGEMGDADYGYVGAGEGKVNLYKGGELVMRAIPEEEAIERLREIMNL